jgi:DNA-binding LytR/AlgR family response regulator
VVAQARNGREAIAHFEALRPDICFLDVQMPGLSGVEAARTIGRRAHLVFVTAFDHYALQAFEHGALDYLVKPVEGVRLADTVQRLQDRLRASQPAQNTELLLQQLAAQLQQAVVAASPAAGVDAAAPLRWVRAAVGDKLRLIPVEEIDYLRSDAKYTLVAWRGEDGKPGEALISVSLKDLLVQLDTRSFAQVHRSVVVNLAAVSHVTRSSNETASIHLKGRAEVLPVSRNFLHLFRQM